MVLPACLKVVCSRAERRFCRLGVLSREVGWEQSDVVVRLECQRKVKSEVFHKKKKGAIKERKEELAKGKTLFLAIQQCIFPIMQELLSFCTSVGWLKCRHTD